jgi:tRNA(Ile)-lysidine synthase TilS/MesJ
MIADGETIAIGVSGGKDSLSLLCALANLRRFYPNRFELHAVTIDMGFEGVDLSPVAELCNKLQVPYTVKQTDAKRVIFPCSLCAKMRRGSLNSRALELGCNKTALGHSKDDVIETLLMCLFFEGRISTFAPVTFLDRMNLHAIRPLIYADERDIKSFALREKLPVLVNTCPVDKSTKREEIKRFIREQSKVYKALPDRLFSAVKGSKIPGWELRVES